MDTQVFLTIARCVFIFFLPGFVLSLIVFNNEKLDIFEKLVYSFILSIIIVPFVIFFGSLFSIPVTFANIAIQIYFVILIFIAIFTILQKKKYL